MKYILFTLLIAFFSGNSASAQVWDKMYNFSTDTVVASSNSAQYAENSFFLGAGQGANFNVDSLTSYIAVFDYDFNLLHKKLLYWPGRYNRLEGQGYNITKAGNDRYVLVGIEQDEHTNSRIEVEQPYFYIFNSKLDSITSKKYFDTIVSRYPYSVAVDKQGNILVTGSISSSSIHYNAWENAWYYDSTFLWVAKYDRNANLLWEKHFSNGTVSGLYGTKIILSHDSTSYLVTGMDYNPADMFSEVFIQKLDTSGKTLWKSFLHVPYQFYFYDGNDLISLASGGYAFMSTFATEPPVSGTPTASNYHYGKINESGGIIWQKHYANNDSESRGNKIAEADNGDLLLLGTVSYIYTWPNVIRTDSNGNIRWYRDYKHVDDFRVGQLLVNISYTPRHQILLSGEIDSQHPLPGVFDTAGGISWFVLTDTFGCTSPGCQVYDTMWHTGIAPISKILEGASVYPNPFSKQVTIATQLSFSQQNNIKAILTDVLGRELFVTTITQQKQTLNLPNLPPGMYYLTLIEEGYKKTFKLVKQ